MLKETDITSKVFAYDADPEALVVLKGFCENNNLIGFRENHNRINKIFDCNIDLGAVFLSESPDSSGRTGIDVALDIHRARPELPLVLRRINEASLDGLPDNVKETFSGVYTLNDLLPLEEFVKDHLFNRFYPSPLVHGIQEITFEALKANIKDVVITESTPCLVKDQLIFGEVFSMIPLESNWCRGYMMLQTTDQDICNIIEAGKTSIDPGQANSSIEVNQLLNEITNVIWGGIKSKFFVDTNDDPSNRPHAVQVPILVNHSKKFISFGATEPQLCFNYIIEDSDGAYAPVTLCQKLIFNLSWMPENMHISEQILSDSIDSGEIELF